MLETLTRPRARAAKSAVGEALNAPLPSEVTTLTARVLAARDGLNQVAAALSEAQDAESKKAADAAVAAAKAALHRLMVRQEMALRIGDGDVPDASEVEELETRLRDAVRAQESHEPRLEALKVEIERRRLALESEIASLESALAPWRESIGAAAKIQLQQAANLAGEALAAMGDGYSFGRIEAPKFKLPNGDTITGVDSADVPDGAMKAHEAIMAARHVAWRHRPLFG